MNQQNHRGNAGRCGGGEKQGRNPWAVAPQGLIRGFQQHPGIGGDKKTDDAANNLQHPSEQAHTKDALEPAAATQAADQGEKAARTEDR